MKLSVIIVNYNVKYFLEQCLLSVLDSLEGIEGEIFVVDNNSVDGSVEMLRKKFPQVNLIANDKNLGFSKANNQAITKAKGEYILLLNPDTVVEKDTFKKVINFMDQHPEAGGLGVKMVDGKGKFLPESKRGLPTPEVAFYKIFGLSKLFPNSKKFGKYHLSYLDNNKIHEVEVLAGAFMLLRKSVLDKIGLLDEEFFMYGEDIDLSYRIIKAGYKNYYYPETRIIHYKGESTKKSSLNYVFTFYNAMLIFARKHFGKEKTRLFSFLIKSAIYFRASLSVLKRFFDKSFLFITDSMILYAGLSLITNYWVKLVKHSDTNYYPFDLLYYYLFPTYTIIILTSVFFNGGYDKPYKVSKIFKGIIIGVIVLLIIYALLPENMRFSRGITLLGGIWAFLSMISLRYFLGLIGLKNYGINPTKKKNIIIIGEYEETQKVKNILNKSLKNIGEVILVAAQQKTTNEEFIGNINQLEEIIRIYKIDEIIFCAKDVKSTTIIDIMTKLHNYPVDFKIAPPDTLYVIGSNSIHTTGELYTIEPSYVCKPENLRNKKIFDILMSIFLFIFSPIIVIFQKNPIGMYLNIINVLIGKYSWIGIKEEDLKNQEIQKFLKKGIFRPFEMHKNNNINQELRNRILIMYINNYKITNDLLIIIKNFKNLGKKA